jgi:hypothetical protein
MLPGLLVSLHNWKDLKKAHVYGETSISLHATVVMYDNVESLTDLLEKAVPSVKSERTTKLY